MELRDIEYFAVVGEKGHLGRAADALGLSQSALSKSLRRLEEALQVKLVKRTPKGVELTAEGSALMLRARELRQSLRSVAREIADVAAGRVGRVRIGVGVPISEELLSCAFARLLQDAPQTTLSVSVSDNDLMIPALHNGELDLIVNFHRPTEGLVSEHLYDDEFCVGASARHRLAGRDDLTVADLAQERWAFSEPSLVTQRFVLDAFRDRGFPPPRVVFESRPSALRLRTVAQSDLLTFASRSALQQAAAPATITILAVKDLQLRFPVALVYRRESYRPPAVTRLIDIIKAAAVQR